MNDEAEERKKGRACSKDEKKRRKDVRENKKR